MAPPVVDEAENNRRLVAGEMYYAFVPSLIAVRERCSRALDRFNDARETTRRQRVQLWRAITQNHEALPPQLPDEEEDAAQFETTDPWVQPPLRCDYGTQLRVAPGAYLNANTTFVDTCPVTIGARTLVGPHCSFYSGTHPLDPAIRQGLEGPEMGKDINIGEDCWLGGNVIVLPGVTLGRGVVVGAGSVVTKSVPAFHVVAGNPARILRKIVTSMDPEQNIDHDTKDSRQGAEAPMAATRTD